MKKTLLSLIAAGALTVGMSNVSATELNFDDVDTNTYIIGTRVYELNKYYLTIYDVVSAATEYAVNNNGETAPIYYLGGGEGEEYLEEITGPADASGEIQTAPKASIESIYPNGVIDATALNASPIVEPQQGDETTIEDIVKEKHEKMADVASDLNNSASTYGFDGITYSDQVLTFSVSNPERELADYADSGIITIIKDNLEYITKATYNVGGEDKVLDLTNVSYDTISKTAREILSAMSTDGELTLGSVMGTSQKVTLTYEYKGETLDKEYTLKFVEGTITSSDEPDETNLDDIIAEEAANLSNKGGIGTISYTASDHTIIFEVTDGTKEVVEYKEDIVSAVQRHLSEISTIVYNGTSYNPSTLDHDALVSLAKTILKDMVGEVDGALTLGELVGKNAQATVDDITYTVKFVEA